MTDIKKKLNALPKNITFIAGVGDGKATACVMTAASIIAGQAFNDAPPCVCPTLRAVAIRLNDGKWWKDNAERTRVLLPFSKKLIGTKSTKLVEKKRVRVAVLHSVRVILPLVLDATKRPDLMAFAVRLRAVKSTATYDSMRLLCREARSAAYAAADDAAYAAAAYAAAAYAADAAADAAAAAADAAAAYAYALGLRLREELTNMLTKMMKVKK